MSPHYLRYPDVHGDLIAFTGADDVWIAPVTGGRAWRLSADGRPVDNPRFSPDGRHVAWRSTVDGHQELMVVPVDGGEQRRLTYFGSVRLLVLGWSADGRVLVATAAGQAHRSEWVARAVSLDGAVETLPYGPVSALAVHPDGPVALSTPYSRPPARWKRYRGGTAPRLWLLRDDRWERLLRDETASLTDPGWVGDRLVFASDLAASFPDHADEQANLYAIDALGDRSVTRLTHHTAAEGYVRDPRTDGRRIVYHARGRLYLMESLDAAPVRLDVDLAGAAPTSAPLAVDPSDRLGRIEPDRHGDASLVEWRGRVAWLPHRDGPARLLAADPAVRCREAHLVPDSDDVLWVSTAPDGDDRLEVRSRVPGGRTRPLPSLGGRVLYVSVAPDGTRAAVVTHDGRVLTVALDDGSSTEVARSTHGEATEPSWSPDGRCLVWAQPVGPDDAPRQVMIATDGSVAALTSGRFDDFSPRFTDDGRYIAFLSARTFDPQYDAQVFALSFASPVRPYMAPVSASDELPFGPTVEGRGAEAGSVDGRRGDDARLVAARRAVAGGGTDRPTADLDVAGFEDRATPLPVPAGYYRELRAVENGLAWVHESSERGELGAARAAGQEKGPDAVEVFSFATGSAKVLADKAEHFEVSGDGTRIVVRCKDEVSVVPVDATGECGADDPRRAAVDLTRLRYTLDRRAEWRQMFAETHRLMAQHFWREDMDGVDWQGIAQRYADAVERVSSHDEFVDVLWEAVGELNSSHAYVTPPVQPRSPQAIGHLGVDVSRAADGWRIDRVLPGESSDPTARSPLSAAGVDARPGDVLVAIDDRPLDAFGPNALLQGAADKPVSLTLRRGDDLRRAVVVPLADETPLRYQDWVRGRVEYVAERSRGRLGYVHVPDMVATGWAQVHRMIRAAMACEGVVVDVRHNRGGHTSQLVLARVMQPVVGWDLIRHQDPTPYPRLGRRGPVAFVTNEQAGSDGDIVCAAAREFGLGPVIGMRSWGGVIGIDGRFDLVDGTAVTQPRYSFWFPSEGWGVENHGVDPDIVVEHSPGDFGTADHQLDAAVDELLLRLAERPAAVPPSLPEPRVGRPRFDA